MFLGYFCKLNKTPSDGTCLGEPPGSFSDAGCCCCCCFTSLKVFLPSLLFDVILRSSVSHCQVFTPILYFQPSSSQSDSRHFHLNFLGDHWFTNCVSEPQSIKSQKYLLRFNQPMLVQNHTGKTINKTC